MQLNRIVRVALWIGTGSLPACGQFYAISSPTSAYTGTTTTVPVSASDNSSLASISLGAQVITFSNPVIAQTVGVNWNDWGSVPNTEGNTPRILTAIDQTGLTLTLSSPVNTFGFEIEPFNINPSPPGPPVAFGITATFLNGSTVLGTVSRSILYNGALLEAASSHTPITSVRISSPVGAGGFALARIRFGVVVLEGSVSVPAVSTSVFCGLGLLLAAGGAILARSQNSAPV